MQLAATLALMGRGLAWRITHRQRLAQRLVEALGHPDDNIRMIAGIMLAKGGRAALPVLRGALAERRNVPEVLTLLGDIGDDSVREDLARLAEDRDERIARAARDALRVLALRQARQSTK
jgi:HEAT repeat protein